MFLHLRKQIHLKSIVTVVVVMWAHFFLPPDVSEGAELLKYYVPPHLLATYLTPVERGAYVWQIYEDIKPGVNTRCSFTQEV